MVSNEVTLLLYLHVCILVLYTSSTVAYQHDFRFISYQDLQSSVTSFQSEGNTSFSQMLFDISRNQIFVGARDGLYRLSVSKLKFLEYANWESSEKKRNACMFKGQKEESCHNFIKVLLSDGKEIWSCGTNAFSPQCSWREINNISNVTKVMDGIAKSPYNPAANITAFLSENGDYYFAGPTDFSGSDSLISKSVGNRVLRTKQSDSFWLNEPQFVGSFETDRFVYFLFREAAVEYMNCGKNVYSRIARVCKNDKGGEQSMFRDNFSTFIKARLNCSLSGDYPFYFNEIQGISYVSTENIVYATFGTPSNSIPGSAICAFNLTTINRAFDGPFKYQQDIDSAWSQHKNSYKDHFNCEATHRKVNLLETSQYHLMDSAVQSTNIDPLHVATGERFTHITIDVVETKLTNVHIIYVATLEGIIKKLSLLPPYKHTCVVEIWQVVPDTNIPIKNMQFLKETNSVYITTNQALMQISVDHCNRHSSWENCQNAMDPYCGWNDREEMCSRAPRGDPHNKYWKQIISTCPSLYTPVDGGWGSWSTWAPCNHRALLDFNSSDQCLCQTRECNNPAPINNGKPCIGHSISVINCTVHGGWSDWSAWSACSATCGTAVKTRTRTCTNPAPAFGGRVCVGQDRMEAFCSEYSPCPSQPIDGGWGPWSPWTSCTAPCGGGYRIRQRKCDNPSPYNGGQHCRGNDVEHERCNDSPCTDIKKIQTTDWVTDTNTTFTGYHKKRYKITCKAPVKFQNQIKISIREEERFCSNLQCNNDDNEFLGWTTWLNWSECSVSCGGGTQKRTRSCRKGRNCLGESMQIKECNIHSCEDTWGCWSEWSPCNVSCGWGVKTRTRTCLGQNCNGPSREQQPCQDQPCEGILGWGNWTEWSLCDQNDEQHRKRKCFHENPGPQECQGKDWETRICFGDFPNEAAPILLESTSCMLVGFSFFFLGAIVGLFPYVAILIYNYFKKKKNTIPSSPHYISAEQNPYISVPTREKLPRKHSPNHVGSYPQNGTIKAGRKFFPDEFEIPTTLKRNSHGIGNGFAKQYDNDKSYYD